MNRSSPGSVSSLPGFWNCVRPWKTWNPSPRKALTSVVVTLHDGYHAQRDDYASYAERVRIARA